ncbi:MAG: B12-binding domain-containing radical SAM protein [bacterium]|nr:B12-binding domain-containing radical SAM protein [bacterium]
MKTALVLPGNSNFRSSAISQAGAEHLGLGYIAAYLRQERHDVAIFNFQITYYLSYWEGIDTDKLPVPSMENCVKEILEYAPDVVGVSVTGVTMEEAVAITNQLKEGNPAMHICWGGHQAYQSAVDILTREKSVDSIVVSDGEVALSMLLKTLESGGAPAEVPGLWFRENGAVKFSGDAHEPDVDLLPSPHRDSLEHLVGLGARVTDARISTSRGCMFNCSFCVDPSLGYRRKWRARSPEKVVAEMVDLVERFGISFFWFSEDNFIPPTPEGRDRAEKIAQLLIEKKLDIGYRALLRADALDGRKPLLEKLALSGLRCVYMGIESGSPRRLAYLRKNETLEQYRRVITLLRQLNIGTQIGFIMFDPLTTWQDLELDARFLHEIDEMYLYSNYCQVLDVFPGAELTQVLIDKGLLDKHFTYDSPICDYRYEIPEIGVMAHAVQSAYDERWIEVDKFFQRLRVVDFPKVGRREAQNDVPASALENLHGIFASSNKKINKSGLDYFMEVLESARTHWDSGRFNTILNNHYNVIAREKELLIQNLSKLPEAIKVNLSAVSSK